MKYIISKRQYDFLLEQKSQRPILKQRYGLEPANAPSDYLGKGGQFERVAKMDDASIKQREMLKIIPPNKIKKVALVFPDKKWYEEYFVSLMKSLGVITGWFRSLAGALGFVQEIEEMGAVTNQLVIGSHGGGQELLITQKEGLFRFDNEFLLNLKNIVYQDTTVFFTACHGADHLAVLKDAAEKIGVGAYGSQGLYNPILNTSEKGFYWCSPKAVDPKLISKNLQTLKPYNWDFSRNLLELRIQAPKGLKTDQLGNWEKISGTLSFKNNKVFENPFPPLKFESEGFSVGSADVMSSKNVEYIRYNIDPRLLVENYFDELGRSKNKNIWSDIYSKMKKKNISIYDNKTYADMLENGSMVIVMTLPTGNVDIKNLKEFTLKQTMTNNFLLKSGFCKKVDKSPISWVDDLLEKLKSLSPF